MAKTSDAVEILNRTFGNSPERRRAIDKEKQEIARLLGIGYKKRVE